VSQNTYSGDIFKYKFEVSLTAIFEKEDKPTKLDEYINEITVYNNYEQHVFPVLQVDMLLDADYYRKIQKNADTVKFMISIKRFKFSGSADEVGSFFDTIVNNVLLKGYDIDRKPLYRDKNEDNQKKFPMQVVAFVSKHVNLNKELINKIILNQDMKNTLLNLLNTAGVSSNVLFSPPDNTVKYEQIIIPPLNLTNTIEYLQTVYGIYNEGLDLFFDFKTYYILTKNKEKAISKKREWKNVYIELIDPTDLGMDLVGCFNDKKNERYLIKTLNNVNFLVSDTSLRELSGENIKFISSSKDKHSVTRFKDTRYGLSNDKPFGVSNDIKPKQKIYWNNYDNSYAENSFCSALARGLGRIQIPFSYLDLDIMTLNKKYYLYFSNEDFAHLSGNYQMVNMIYKLVKGKSVNLFDIHGVCLMEKLPKST
jgi:hypothetical protein